LGIPLWALRSRYELAQLSLRSGAREAGLRDLAEVADEAKRVGLARLARVASEAIDSEKARPAPSGVFLRTAPLWTLEFDRPTVGMRASKGLRDLGTLLAAPGRPIAAADLVAATSGDLAQADLGMGADEILDATARRQFRERLRNLDDEIAEAEH